MIDATEIVTTAQPDVWESPNGKNAPVPDGTVITVMIRKGEEVCPCVVVGEGRASEDFWVHEGHPRDIIAWRYPTSEEVREFNEVLVVSEALKAEATQWLDDFHERAVAHSTMCKEKGFDRIAVQMLAAYCIQGNEDIRAVNIHVSAAFRKSIARFMLTGR